MIKTDLKLAKKYGTNTIEHFGINTTPTIRFLNKLKLTEKKLNELAKSVGISRHKLDNLRGKGKWFKVGTIMFTPDHDFCQVNIAYLNGNLPTLDSPKSYIKKWEKLKKPRKCLKCKNVTEHGIYCKTCTHQDINKRKLEAENE